MFILFEGVTVSEEVALFRGKGKETTERERGRIWYLSGSDFSSGDAHLLVMTQLDRVDDLVMRVAHVTHQLLVLFVLLQQLVHVTCCPCPGKRKIRNQMFPLSSQRKPFATF